MSERRRAGAGRLWHPVEVRLDDAQWEQLQTIAARDHTQAPTIIRQALDLFFQTRGFQARDRDGQ